MLLRGFSSVSSLPAAQRLGDGEEHQRPSSRKAKDPKTSRVRGWGCLHHCLENSAPKTTRCGKGRVGCLVGFPFSPLKVAGVAASPATPLRANRGCETSRGFTSSAGAGGRSWRGLWRSWGCRRGLRWNCVVGKKRGVDSFAIFQLLFFSTTQLVFWKEGSLERMGKCPLEAFAFDPQFQAEFATKYRLGAASRLPLL